MNKYVIEFKRRRDLTKKGKTGKKREDEIVISANSEVKARNKFYQKHHYPEYTILSIDLMKEVK